jgi:hypothetical protein
MAQTVNYIRKTLSWTENGNQNTITAYFPGKKGKKDHAAELSECVFLAYSDGYTVVLDNSLRNDKGLSDRNKAEVSVILGCGAASV